MCVMHLHMYLHIYIMCGMYVCAVHAGMCRLTNWQPRPLMQLSTRTGGGRFSWASATTGMQGIVCT